MWALPDLTKLGDQLGDAFQKAKDDMEKSIDTTLGIAKQQEQAAGEAEGRAGESAAPRWHAGRACGEQKAGGRPLAYAQLHRLQLKLPAFVSHCVALPATLRAAGAHLTPVPVPASTGADEVGWVGLLAHACVQRA